MAKRMTKMVVITLAIISVLVCYKVFVVGYFMKKFLASFGNIPTISSNVAKQETWQPKLHAVGSLTAKDGVNVTTQISGMIAAISFTSGQEVKAGDVLVKLDDRSDQQDLQSSQAQLQVAKLNYQRTWALVQKNVTSQSDLDTAVSQLKQADAAVNKIKVIISQKTVTAPFNGKLGIRQVNLGQYVSAGDTFVNLQSFDPLFVDFYLPEQYVPSLYIKQKVDIILDSFPKQTFHGEIVALGAQIDPKTRNIAVRANVPNPSHIMYPGMFANINILLSKQKQVVTVPQTAITYNLYGDNVYVLEAKGKDEHGDPLFQAKRQDISTGEMQGNRVEITKGLKAGELVATSGQLKIENGTTVKVNNSIDMDKTNTHESIY